MKTGRISAQVSLRGELATSSDALVGALHNHMPILMASMSQGWWLCLARRRLGKIYLGWVVSNLLDVVGHLLDNFFVSLLVILGLSGIHLVQGNNELLHTQGVSQQGMLARLPILGDT